MLICAVSDAALIFAGILGIGLVVEQTPVALIVIRIVGAAFLLAYGVFAAVRAFRPRALVADASPIPISTGVAVATMLALTWLNPHVYLDTLIFLGSVANQQGESARWWWGAGAIMGSFVWFFSLGFGARHLRRFFARPSSWRILDGFIAVVMLSLGAGMALGV